MHQLASALETRNFALLEFLLVEDMNFTSPVGSTYQGQQMAVTILKGATELLDSLHYTEELTGESQVVLRFQARVGGHKLEGCHFLKLNSTGRIQEMTTMMRPFPAVTAFHEGMEAYRLRLMGETPADS